MKTFDSDTEYHSLNSSNGKEDATDFLIEDTDAQLDKNNLLRCNADLAKSFNVLKATPMGHKGRFYQRVLLKNNVTQDSRSQSLPNSLDEKNSTKTPINSNETIEICDKFVPEVQVSPPVSPVHDLWFKTWPERYERKIEDENSNSEGNSPEGNGNVGKKVSLNEALENISLAYSPITKQLHLIKKNVLESQNVEDDNCQFKEQKVVKSGHSRSSTVSSLSDFSPSGSLLDAEERLSFKDAGDEKIKKSKSFFNRNVFSWNKLFTKGKEESTVQGSPQHCCVVASSSALIQNPRPSTLPAKTEEEEQRHREEYRAILAAAKKKEAQNNATKQRQQKIQLRLEEQLATATKYFTQTVIPNWDTMLTAKKTKDLWWQGLPSSVRGKVWRLAIGNDLNLTPQLYDICLSRAQNRLNRSDSPPNSDPDIDQESSMDVIQLDIARTFPSLCIFQEGGPYSDILHSLLAAYVCYRPDIGYVQGMSYIAAILILNMDPYDAFVCFANLLNKPLHVAAFTLNQRQMRSYYKAFNEVFNYCLPKLCTHFERAGLTPDMYLLDWVYTIYAKAMPLDVACRVWDVFLRDGDEFIFRTALGILNLHQDTLMQMDFLHGAQFLTKLPDDLSPDQLFRSIQVLSTNIGKQSFSQIVERCSLSSNDT